MFQWSRREQIGALALAGLLVVGIVLRILWTPKPVPVVIERAEERQSAAEPVIKEIVVHVAGAVAQPGIVTLKEGARVFEALAAAGGVLQEGDAHALNLAEPLFDGRRIFVPFVGEQGASPGGTVDGRININTASTAELEKLPGIGPAKAAAIISYREKNGPFQSLDDLAGVSGIGPKTVDTFKEQITLY